MSRIDTSSEGGADESPPARCDTSSDPEGSPCPSRCDTSSSPGDCSSSDDRPEATARRPLEQGSKAIAKAKAKPKVKAKGFFKVAVTATGKTKQVLKQHVKAVPAAAGASRRCSAAASGGDVDDAAVSEGESVPTSPSLAFDCPAGADSSRSVPATSGVGDYIEWAIDHVLTSEERKALGKRISVGSMCAGMGMEEVALHFLRQALLKHSIHLEAEASFKAEKDKVKMEFLQRHSKAKDVEYFNDNMALAKVPTYNSKGLPVKQPAADLLLCGIVCKDISQLNNKPKSERDDGVSNWSLSGLLAYIRSLSFELRPKLLLLECVQRLGHSRAVDPDSRKGTEYITDELGGEGYVLALVSRNDSRAPEFLLRAPEFLWIREPAIIHVV
jgi:hypothetical protein